VKLKAFVLQYYLMKTAIDFTQVPRKKTGIGIHALNLIRELSSMLPSNPNPTPSLHQIYLFTQDDDPEWKQAANENPNIRLIPIKSRWFRFLPLRFLFEQLLLPHYCKKLGISIIFSFHYTTPYLTKIPRIAWFPDMTFYLFPSLHRLIKRIYFKTLIPLSARVCEMILTVSESTRNDILSRFTGINPGKIHVIHLGVTPPPPLTRDQISPLLQKFNVTPKKYFLYIGTLEPRKNITAIIEAFNHLTLNPPNSPSNTGDFKLVIAGSKGWFYQTIFETTKKYGLEKSIVFTGYIDEETKQALLEGAFLFVYPSFYEGFGLPVLEAMSHGIPVITGNCSSLPEVAGDAAIQIDPYKWEEIAGAMRRLMENDSLYGELSEKSSKRAKEFTWSKNAEKTLDILSLVFEKTVKKK